MKPSVLPLTFALVACGKDDTTLNDSDSAVTTPPVTTFSGYADADLTDADTVRALTYLSAEQLYYRLQLTFQAAFSGSDPKCPLVDESDPYHLLVTGGCTDAAGVEWKGTMAVDSVGKGGDATVSFDGFGYTGLPFDCYGVAAELNQDLTGTVAVDSVAQTLAADLAGLWTRIDILTCTTEDVNHVLQYELLVTDLKGASQYSGSGRYADDLYGYVEPSTIAQVELDVGCSSESESGATRLTNESHEAVISYDGGVDCDDPGTVSWTLDGAPQGEILGISCSSTPAAAGWLALAPLAALIRRRR